MSGPYKPVVSSKAPILLTGNLVLGSLLIAPRNEMNFRWLLNRIIEFWPNHDRKVLEEGLLNSSKQLESDGLLVAIGSWKNLDSLNIRLAKKSDSQFLS